MSDPYQDLFEDAELIEAQVVVSNLGDVDLDLANRADADDGGVIDVDAVFDEETPDAEGHRRHLDSVTESAHPELWPGRTRKEYGAIQPVALRIPLFVISAPAVPGCKTTMESASSNSLGWSIELELFGNGGSLGKKITVSWSNEVTVGAGRVSQIFLPIWVDVQEVTIYFDGGREEQVVYEVSLRRGDLLKQRVGVRTLADWTPPNGPRVEILQALLGDQSPSDDPVVMKFGYESESSGEISIGFEAFGAKQKFKVSGTRTRSHELSASLSPGRNYLGTAGIWPPYLSWTVDTN